MAQYDYHAVANDAAEYAPYLIELQSDLVSGLDAVIVAPLLPLASAGPLVKRLNPIMRIDGDDYVLRIEELVSLPRAALGNRIGSLKNQRDAMTAAIDLLFLGF